MALSQPEVIADEALRRRLYPGHPYAAGMPRPASLRRVSPETLRGLHPSILNPANGCLVLVGDLDPRRALATAGDLLEPWLGTVSGASTDLPDLPPIRLGPIELVGREGSVQSNIRLARSAPTRSQTQWPATSIANLIFGGLFASRLVENLRERHGYTYSPGSSIRHARAGSSLVIEADVGTESTAAALIETRYELGRLAVEGVTTEELDSARRYAVGTFAFLTATQSGLAETLATLALAGVGPGYLTSHPAALAKTTKAEVDDAARAFFGPAGFVSVVVGDAEKITEPLAAVDAVTVAR
jgi:predicted Zn-dependent peptidase